MLGFLRQPNLLELSPRKALVRGPVTLLLSLIFLLDFQEPRKEHRRFALETPLSLPTGTGPAKGNPYMDARTSAGSAGVEGDKGEACFARPERHAHAGAWQARFGGRISPTLSCRFCGGRNRAQPGRRLGGQSAKRQSTALPARSAKRVQTLGRKRGRRIAVP